MPLMIPPPSSRPRLLRIAETATACYGTQHHDCAVAWAGVLVELLRREAKLICSSLMEDAVHEAPQALGAFACLLRPLAAVLQGRPSPSSSPALDHPSEHDPAHLHALMRVACLCVALPARSLPALPSHVTPRLAAGWP